MSSGKGLAMMVVLIFTYLVAVALGSLERAEDRAPLTAHSGSGPCDHLDYVNTSSGTVYRHDMSPTSFVRESHAVAKVVIDTIDAPRFNTTDGLPPPPLPQVPTDDEWAEYDDKIMSAVVVTATNVYTGTANTGYVLIRWGGTAAVCPDYIHEVEPQILTGDVGDEAMAFLMGIPTSIMQSPPPWLAYAIGIRDALNSNPETDYEVMLLFDWYEYDGTLATSQLQPDDPVEIVDLEDEVSHATQ